MDDGGMLPKSRIFRLHVAYPVILFNAMNYPVINSIKKLNLLDLPLSGEHCKSLPDKELSGT